MSARKERAESKGQLATDLALSGAAIGSVYGPAGTVAGGVVGGLAGLIIADREIIFPIDMIAIPAYQAHMLQGNPAFQIYIKEGEVLNQVILTDAQEAQASTESIVGRDLMSTPKKKRKANPWIKFSKSFSYRAKRKNETAQAYLSARNKAASRAYKKGKGGTKKGQVRKTARRAYKK